MYLYLQKALILLHLVKMIDKLRAMGLDLSILARVRSYLTDRQQCVKLKS